MTDLFYGNDFDEEADRNASFKILENDEKGMLNRHKQC